MVYILSQPSHKIHDLIQSEETPFDFISLMYVYVYVSTANNCSAEFSIDNSTSIIPDENIFTGYNITVECAFGFHISTNVSSDTDVIQAQCTAAPEGNWTNIPSCDGGYLKCSKRNLTLSYQNIPLFVAPCSLYRKSL